MSKINTTNCIHTYFEKNKRVAWLSLVFLCLAMVQITILVPSITLMGSLSQNATWNTDVKQQTEQTTLVQGVAKRLQRRLQEKGVGVAPQLNKLENAVRERQVLLKRRTTIDVALPDGSTQSHFMHLYYNPLWIKADFTDSDAHFSLNEEVITQWMEDNISGELIPPQNTVLKAVLSGAVTRVETEGLAKEGDVFDSQAALQSVTDGLYSGSDTIALQVSREQGSIENATGLELGNLEFLAAGKSDYNGSTWGRMVNVQKALNEHVNNVLVAPGETFSFNETLGGPVTQSRGWAMGKIIVDGSKLQAAPGGGICQASTTTYRAMLNAGFKATERKSHSMYVSYYEQYGVGIDATIFPGFQDLTFVNDTENYILIQAYNDGFLATVNMYGTNDGRTTELVGPYFRENAPEGFTYNGKALDGHDIAWAYTIHYADGTAHEEIIRSRYSTLPRYIVNKYMDTVREGSQETMHASAQ